MRNWTELRDLPPKVLEYFEASKEKEADICRLPDMLDALPALGS